MLYDARDIVRLFDSAWRELQRAYVGFPVRRVASEPPIPYIEGRVPYDQADDKALYSEPQKPQVPPGCVNPGRQIKLEDE